jgi:hypothetical protein
MHTDRVYDTRDGAKSLRDLLEGDTVLCRHGKREGCWACDAEAEVQASFKAPQRKAEDPYRNRKQRRQFQKDVRRGRVPA